MERLRKVATSINAVEVHELLAEHLFNYSHSMTTRLALNISKSEKQMDALDKEMCEAITNI